MREFVLGVEPFMQPHPARNPGGDCFACAMMAALRHLFPERPPTFEQVFDLFEAEYTTGGKCTANTWNGMRVAIMRAGQIGCDCEIAAHFCHPTFNPWEWSHAWYQWDPTGTFARDLEGYLRGGWVAFSEINFAGTGPVDAEMRWHSPDHFVALDGVRLTGNDIQNEIHVVCSVKGGYWINERTLIRKHGAAGLWLARRDER